MTQECGRHHIARSCVLRDHENLYYLRPIANRAAGPTFIAHLQPHECCNVDCHHRSTVKVVQAPECDQHRGYDSMAVTSHEYIGHIGHITVLPSAGERASHEYWGTSSGWSFGFVVQRWHNHSAIDQYLEGTHAHVYCTSPSSGSEVSDIDKLRSDMRTLVQMYMSWPEAFKFKVDPMHYGLFCIEFEKAMRWYPHDAAQKLELLWYGMVVEPAKSIIADCWTISDPAMALNAAWETLLRVYGYMATNVPSQLANIINKPVVELSDTGLQELITDLNAY